MIPVESAREILMKNRIETGIETLPLDRAQGRILRSPILSPVDHPHFDMSAVDGYAVVWSDALAEGASLRLIGEVPAGGDAQVPLEAGCCVRIFTGAKVPAGYDTVVMQEFSERRGDSVFLKDTGIRRGSNVRRKGEQIRAGEEALSAGLRINGPLSGFLATMGIQDVEVSRNPRIRLIVTGNEFARSLDELEKGKIFESNSSMMRSSLRAFGWDCEVAFSPDDPEKMSGLVQRYSEESDILIMTGGVSVGDYDFTPEALMQNGYETLFHKIRMKPGKPFLFARKGEKVAFGLPGNPRSVMMDFYVFILPYIEASLGKRNPGLRELKLPLAESYTKKGDRAEFLTCEIKAGRMHLTGKQDSHMLRSFESAAGIAYFPAEPSVFEAGTEVSVFILPN